MDTVRFLVDVDKINEVLELNFQIHIVNDNIVRDTQLDRREVENALNSR